MLNGPSPEFDRVVREANAAFLDEVGRRGHVVEYGVGQPYATLVELESLVSGLLQGARPMIVPLGPKPFALASILVAVALYPDVSVWCVSAESYEDPVDRVPTGDIVGLGVRAFPALIMHERTALSGTALWRPA